MRKKETLKIIYTISLGGDKGYFYSETEIHSFKAKKSDNLDIVLIKILTFLEINQKTDTREKLCNYNNQSSSFSYSFYLDGLNVSFFLEVALCPSEGELHYHRNHVIESDSYLPKSLFGITILSFNEIIHQVIGTMQGKIKREKSKFFHLLAVDDNFPKILTFLPAAVSIDYHGILKITLIEDYRIAKAILLQCGANYLLTDLRLRGAKDTSIEASGETLAKIYKDNMMQSCIMTTDIEFSILIAKGFFTIHKKEILKPKEFLAILINKWLDALSPHNRFRKIYNLGNRRTPPTIAIIGEYDHVKEFIKNLAHYWGAKKPKKIGYTNIFDDNTGERHITVKHEQYFNIDEYLKRRKKASCGSIATIVWSEKPFHTTSDILQVIL